MTLTPTFLPRCFPPCLLSWTNPIARFQAFCWRQLSVCFLLCFHDYPILPCGSNVIIVICFKLGWATSLPRSYRSWFRWWSSCLALTFCVRKEAVWLVQQGWTDSRFHRHRLRTCLSWLFYFKTYRLLWGYWEEGVCYDFMVGVAAVVKCRCRCLRATPLTSLVDS